jgi:hypothetical protein
MTVCARADVPRRGSRKCLSKWTQGTLVDEQERVAPTPPNVRPAHTVDYPPREINMPTIELKPSYPELIWLDIFAARLLQLRPSMKGLAAAEHAMVAFQMSADLEPDEAAESFDGNESTARADSQH